MENHRQPYGRRSPKPVLSIERHRGLFAFLGGVLVAGLFTRRIHPLAVLVLPLSAPVYFSFRASLGLAFSVRAKNPGRATFWMWTVTLFAQFTVTTLLNEVLTEAMMLRPPSETVAFSVTMPPVTAAFAVLPLDGPRSNPRADSNGVALVTGAISMAIYGARAWLLGRLEVRRFEREWEGHR